MHSLVGYFFIIIISFVFFPSTIYPPYSLFHSHPPRFPLVDSCMCPQQGSNLQPWCIQTRCFNQATFFLNILLSEWLAQLTFPLAYINLAHVLLSLPFLEWLFSHTSAFFFFFFFKDFIYSFIHLLLESGEGREEEGVKHWCERNVDPLPLILAPTGDGTHIPGMCPDLESSWWPFASWDDTQATELHWPGLGFHFHWSLLCLLKRI